MNWRHELEILVVILVVAFALYKMIFSGTTAWLSQIVMTFKDNQQSFLTISSTALLAGVVVLIVFVPIPAQSEKVMDILTGAIATQWVAVMNFYFGSSSGSAKKTDAIIAAQKGGQQ